MKVKKILHRLASAPESERELRRVARSLANEFTRQRLRVLREFRSGLATLQSNRIDESTQAGMYASGYMASLLDVTAEYEVHLQEVDDSQAVARVALREDWREVLGHLQGGARLPSDLASVMGKDRPTITRVLKKMRLAGLVETFASDSLDGRMRPHRLTLRGRALYEQLGAEVRNLSSGTGGAAAGGAENPGGAQRDPSGGMANRDAAGAESGLGDEIARGIALAVSLFRQLGEHPDTSARQLDRIAEEILQNDVEARNAVRIWARETERAGLRAGLIDGRDSTTPASSPAADAEAAPAGTSQPAGNPSVSERALWNRIPAIMSELEQYRGDMPVFVRTSDGTWGAWAYALEGDQSGMSRTIVKGDILAQSLTPPDSRFALVYDNPEAIDADREEPAMRAFLERADNKFVVTTTADQAPEGFIPLSARELAEEE